MNQNMKYKVKKYHKSILLEETTMTIEELKEYAKQFIGDVFVDEKDVERDMEYIEKNGDEGWLAKYQIQIVIDKEVEKSE